MSAGAEVAVSAIHVGGSTEVDDIRFQRDTHSARLGARFGYGYSYSPTLRGRVEITGGSLLRSIPMQLGGERLALGGGYLGLNLGVTIAPNSDPR